MLGCLVRRALSPARADRPGDRRSYAGFDRTRRFAALLHAAAERDPRSRARHGRERRAGGRADARVRRERRRVGVADRRRRRRASRAREQPPARSRAARAGRGGGELDVRAAAARGVVLGVRARARRRRQRQDRSRRRRSAERARHRRRLQVGRRPVGGPDPRRGAPADPAVPARAPRPSSGSSRWAGSTCRSAVAGGRAGCSSQARRPSRDSPQPTTSTRMRSPSEMEHAREAAVALVGRIRAGDVRHDPRGGECPTWCDLWRICRKERP